MDRWRVWASSPQVGGYPASRCGTQAFPVGRSPQASPRSDALASSRGAVHTAQWHVMKTGDGSNTRRPHQIQEPSCLQSGFEQHISVVVNGMPSPPMPSLGTFAMSGDTFDYYNWGLLVASRGWSLKGMGQTSTPKNDLAPEHLRCPA